MIRIFILLLVISSGSLNYSHLYAQAKNSPSISEVDSLKTLAKRTPSGMDKIEIYGKICFLYTSALGNVNLAKLYADSIKQMATKLDNKAAIACSDYYNGIVSRYDGKNSDALNYLQRQITYCKLIGDSMQLAKGLAQISVVHENMGNYEKSLAINYRIINIYENQAYYYGVGITLMSVGNVFIFMKKWNDAIATYTKAFLTLDSLRPNLEVRMGRLRVLMNLGNTYLEMKQYGKALKFYKKSLAISDSLGSKRTRSTCLSSLGEILNGLGKYDSALTFHLSALAIREQTSQRDKTLLSLLRVGETYLYLKNTVKAKAYLFRAISLSRILESKPGLRDGYEKLAILYANQKDYKKAYQFYQLFSTMKDSIFNEETVHRFDELQTKYETGQKDKQITLLAKENEIQEKEAQRQAALKKAFIGGVLFLIILVGLLSYLFFMRLKNQKLLAIKNSEIKEAVFRQQMSELEMKALRAQINPHFIFNCMNSINRMILNNDASNASLYLSKFSKLIRLILENGETESVSLENELALLESYIQMEALRFKGRINYKISVAPGIVFDNTYLPSMLLQPFVENAIWHGLIHRKDHASGNITIDISKKNDYLHCIIEDNGIGREMAGQLRENSLLKSRSMGIKITEQRLKLFSNRQTKELIRIIDLKNGHNIGIGTRVELNIPTL